MSMNTLSIFELDRMVCDIKDRFNYKKANLDNKYFIHFVMARTEQDSKYGLNFRHPYLQHASRYIDVQFRIHIAYIFRLKKQEKVHNDIR